MDKKQFCIEQALKLFLKQGIRKTTIGNITTHLNISSKTIYKLFEDREGLVNACVQYDYHNVHQSYKKILENKDILDALLHFYEVLITRIRYVHPNYTKDIRRYFPKIWEEATLYGTQYIQELLKRGIKKGIFQHKMDTSIVAITLTLLMKAMLEGETFTKHTYNVQMLFFHIIYPYLKGICTAKGLDAIKKISLSIVFSQA